MSDAIENTPHMPLNKAVPIPCYSELTVNPPPCYTAELSRPILQEEEVPTHFLGSFLTTCFCCFPAGLAGLFFSWKTFKKNEVGNIAGARRSSRLAKRCVWVSFIFGIFFLCYNAKILARQVNIIKVAYEHEYSKGLIVGQVNGINYAQNLVLNNKRIVLPDSIPSQVNPFDVRKSNPFWAKILRNGGRHLLSVEVAFAFGYQFGWNEGFLIGFCGVRGAECDDMWGDDSGVSISWNAGWL